MQKYVGLGLFFFNVKCTHTQIRLFSKARVLPDPVSLHPWSSLLPTGRGIQSETMQAEGPLQGHALHLLALQ